MHFKIKFHEVCRKICIRNSRSLKETELIRSRGTGTNESLYLVPCIPSEDILVPHPTDTWQSSSVLSEEKDGFTMETRRVHTPPILAFS
ncbi:hypothetical protein CY34DRAFT_812084 [Suillus luteus UH-Slu-Lm8-n1]|uniref:Uncharacterized protein n=1 Tax=Suillus luteus UH-Slu-Lm8-n1 TaxID=930992 RepID=A0A0D0ABT8_9AGAM|nr:hypothetical protein CY34DRAFT_812084 [Suillus luteus UH-Slu-Lm8-n1]